MAAICRQDRADYQRYLLRLAELEIADRERRAAQRRVKAARFPVIKTLDTFDFKAQPSINEQLVREFLRGEYIDQRENVLFIGNSGTGKTHLATAPDLPFEAWVEILGGERLTGALLDRLTRRVHTIEANGPSCRLGEAKRRLRKQTGKSPAGTLPTGRMPTGTTPAEKPRTETKQTTT